MMYIFLILILSISYSNQISSISRDINDLSVMNSNHFIKDVTNRGQNKYYIQKGKGRNPIATNQHIEKLIQSLINTLKNF